MHDAIPLEDPVTVAQEVAFAFAKGVGVAVEVTVVAVAYLPDTFSVTDTDEVTVAFAQPLGAG